MQPDEIKSAIQAKTVEFELAMEFGKPHKELLKIYKELKELQYRLVSTEHNLDAIQS